MYRKLFVMFVKTGGGLLSKLQIICVLICLGLSFPVLAEAADGKLFLSYSGKNRANIVADSVMKMVIEKSAGYEHLVNKYEAEVYVKGHSEVLKKNMLFRFAPNIIPVDRRNRNNIFEMVSDLKFTAPNRFVHKFEAVNGTVFPDEKRQAEVLGFLNINIYAPTAYNDEVLLPLAKNAFKLYRFSLDTITHDSGYKMYKIRFEPRRWSQKVLCGYLYILDGLWSVDKLDANGRLDFAEFNVVMQFGREFNYFFLPKQMDLSLRYRVLGNVVVTDYTSTFHYKQVQWREINQPIEKSLDLSQYYNIVNDSIPVIKDSVYWNVKRKIPLTKDEQELYEKAEERVVETDPLDTSRYIALTQKIINPMKFNYKSTRMKYSGFLNPFELGYSGSRGITYRQKLRLSKTLSGDRLIRFAPEVGYVFKRKEIFFKVGGDWVFMPKRMGTLSLWVGNNNQGYSSEVTSRINEILKDSTYKFDDLDVKYYKDYYVDLRSKIEIFNGFRVGLGLSYHYRKPVKTLNNDEMDDEITSLINGDYGDFTPILNLEYTPRQYYRMDGKRKEYVRSSFPTLSFEYARGIANVWGSDSEYERMELDMQQNVNLGLLRFLNYHVGGGFFSNQKSVYFANFAFFARRNFPDSWVDRMGGVFQLLEGYWYNASSSYAQAHVMYESPFLLLPLLKKKIATKYVFSERFYFSQLYMPILPSYTEIGYGVGNHLFNIGVFASFKGCEYHRFGVKFAFELFQ